MRRARRTLGIGLLAAGSLLLAGIAPAAAADGTMSPRDLVPLLTRHGVAPDLTLIEVIYAPPLFFESTGLQEPPEMETQPTLAFIFQETVHDGELPLVVPEAFLLMPDGLRLAPYDAGVTAEDDHHRVSRLLFPRPEDWPDALQGDEGDAVLSLIVPQADGSFTVSNVFKWSIPIEYDTDEVEGQ